MILVGACREVERCRVANAPVPRGSLLAKAGCERRERNGLTVVMTNDGELDGGVGVPGPAELKRLLVWWDGPSGLAGAGPSEPASVGSGRAGEVPDWRGGVGNLVQAPSWGSGLR